LAIAQSLNLAAAQAATIEVTSSFDDGVGCTLRDAIFTANGGPGFNQNNGCTVDTTNGPLGSNDTIIFNASVAGDTIVLERRELIVISSVSINPGGLTTTITPSANDESSVFFIDGIDAVPYGSLSVSLNNLFITGGRDSFGGGINIGLSSNVVLNNSIVSGNFADDFGGGVFVDGSSNLSLNNSTISNNIAYRGGGGLEISVDNTVTLNNSSVSNNLVIGYYNDFIGEITYYGAGGGLSAGFFNTVSLNNSSISGNAAYYAGGGINVDGTNTIILNDSTVAQNSAFIGGGINAADGSVSLRQSTVSDNLATIFGGGIFADNDANVNLTNSTVSSNLSAYGGGVLLLNAATSLTLINSTFSANSAALYGGGILLNGSTATLRNSIIANSSGGGDCAFTYGSVFNSGATNIVPDGTCGADTQTVNPRLGPLADNGGPTLTHALLRGSSAIDASQGRVATATDQRGFSAFGVRDIGAFEFSANESDTDGDGLNDGYERANGLNPFDASDRNADPDGDGFTNFEEFEFGTDPQVADPDNNNNGVPDSLDPPTISPTLQLLLLEE